MKKITLFAACLLSMGTITHTFSMKILQNDISGDRIDNQAPIEQEETEIGIQQEELLHEEIQIPEELRNSPEFKKFCHTLEPLVHKYHKICNNFKVTEKEAPEEFISTCEKILTILAESPITEIIMPETSLKLKNFEKRKRHEIFQGRGPRHGAVHDFIFDNRQLIVDICKIIEKQATVLMGQDRFMAACTKKKCGCCCPAFLATLGFVASTAVAVLTVYFNVK